MLAIVPTGKTFPMERDVDKFSMDSYVDFRYVLSCWGHVPALTFQDSGG